MTQGAEIRYWSYKPNDTKVWVRKATHSQWLLVIAPNWLPRYFYVVDDEWAEIAKQFIDDSSKVEHKDINNNWAATIAQNIYDLRLGDITEYRIKPKEPVYEWQYSYINPQGIYAITKEFYTPNEVTQEDLNIGFMRFEPSRRER